MISQKKKRKEKKTTIKKSTRIDDRGTREGETCIRACDASRQNNYLNFNTFALIINYSPVQSSRRVPSFCISAQSYARYHTNALFTFGPLRRDRVTEDSGVSFGRNGLAGTKKKK